MEIVRIYVCAILFTVSVRIQQIKSHTAMNSVKSEGTRPLSSDRSPGLRLSADSNESLSMARQQAGGGISVTHLRDCTVNNSRMDLT
jgi:hypothetical protein